MQEAEDKDWNEEWEKNYFKPLVVDGRCVIASTFHTDVPKAEYSITINPQMSFGTGHHATTSQMISRLLNDDITGLEVLDMGCGTSILAILARMRGAKHCLGIDVDEWCVKIRARTLASTILTTSMWSWAMPHHWLTRARSTLSLPTSIWAFCLTTLNITCHA